MSLTTLAFREEYIQTRDGLSLRLRIAEIDGPVLADIVLTHGLGEFCGRYGHVAAALAARGLRLWTYDLRGHGRSGGRRGDASEYRLLVEDLQSIINHARKDSTVLFVMGHSLGGQITLSYLLEHGADGLRGAVITSPWLRLAFVPPRWRVLLAKAAMYFFPGLSQRTPSEATQLSRDMEHLASMQDLELCHDRISGRLFFSIEKAGAEALERASELTLPILLIHGGEDLVTCRKATELFHERLRSEDKTLIIYPEARHETHNDLCRERVLADIRDWIEIRAGS